jgi:hypothetical protein
MKKSETVLSSADILFVNYDAIWETTFTNKGLSDESFLEIGLKNDPILKAYYKGECPEDTESYEDDVVFVNKLAFWCNGNRDLIESACFSSPYFGYEGIEEDAREDLSEAIKESLRSLDSTARKQYDQWKLTHCNNKDITTTSSVTGKSTTELLQTFTASDLHSMEVPEINFVVNGMIAQGVNLLTVTTKKHANWLCHDLVLSVANGLPFLGQSTFKCGVLYFAFGDGIKGIQERQNLIMNDQMPPSGVYYSLKANPIDQGFEAQIDQHMNAYPDTGLIVVSSLEGICSSKTTDKRSSPVDYSDLQVLKSIATKHQVALLLVNYSKKARDIEDCLKVFPNSGRFFDEVDSVALLSDENRKDGTSILSIDGRDLKGSDFVIKFDHNISHRWQMISTLGDERKSKYETNPVVIVIKALLGESSTGKIEYTSSELKTHMLDQLGIVMDEREIGKAISVYNSDFYQFDKIVHEEGNSKNRKHCFYYKGNSSPMKDRTQSESSTKNDDSHATHATHATHDTDGNACVEDKAPPRPLITIPESSKPTPKLPVPSVLVCASPASGNRVALPYCKDEWPF